jgi:hypothetical protein
MSTIRINDRKLAKYRVHFYSYDCSEKMHVHVEYDECEAKFWVEWSAEADSTTLILHSSTNYSQKELHSITKALEHHGKTITTEWQKHCTNYGSSTRSDASA